MLKKTITYTDYNGTERTEDLYFNISKAELAEMELGVTGGFSEMMKKIIAAQDVPSIVKIVKDLILKSYGEKSSDGRRFIKSPELSEAFSQTEAYTEVFLDVVASAGNMAAFVNAIIPSDISRKAGLPASEI